MYQTALTYIALLVSTMTAACAKPATIGAERDYAPERRMPAVVVARPNWERWHVDAATGELKQFFSRTIGS